MKTLSFRKISYLALVIVMVLTFTVGCSPSSDQGASTSGDPQAPAADPAQADPGKVYTLRAAAASVDPSSEALCNEEFKRLIEEATDRIVVETYPGGAAGTNVQTITGLQDGSIQAVCIPAGYWEAFCPEIGVTGLPMTFAGPEEIYQVLKEDGELGDLLDAALAEKGFVIGAWLRDCDSRFLSKKPIGSVADLKGMKVWCMANTKINDTINALGGTAVNFDTGDLAVSLQQGTIDCVYTGNTLFRALKLYESAKYLDISKVVINVNALMLSKPWLDSLPEDLRQIVMDCAEQAGQWHYDYNTTQLDACMTQFIDNGVTVSYADDAFLDYAKEVTKPIIEGYVNQSDTCKAIYDAAIKQVDAYTGEAG